MGRAVCVICLSLSTAPRCCEHITTRIDLSLVSLLSIALRLPRRCLSILLSLRRVLALVAAVLLASMLGNERARAQSTRALLRPLAAPFPEECAG